MNYSNSNFLLGQEEKYLREEEEEKKKVSSRKVNVF